MIESFKHKGLKQLFEDGDGRKIRPDLAARVVSILTVLNAANAPAALDLPGYRLHALKGDMAGYWAVTVRANWRIVFRFENGAAVNVDLIDYH